MEKDKETLLFLVGELIQLRVALSTVQPAKKGSLWSTEGYLTRQAPAVIANCNALINELGIQVEDVGSLSLFLLRSLRDNLLASTQITKRKTELKTSKTVTPDTSAYWYPNTTWLRDNGIPFTIDTSRNMVSISVREAAGGGPYRVLDMTIVSFAGKTTSELQELIKNAAKGNYYYYSEESLRYSEESLKNTTDIRTDVAAYNAYNMGRNSIFNDESVPVQRKRDPIQVKPNDNRRRINVSQF